MTVISKCEHSCTSDCRRRGCNCWCGEWHCSTCNGTGEIDTYGQVYAEQPEVIALLATAPCPDCRPREDEEE